MFRSAGVILCPHQPSKGGVARSSSIDQCRQSYHIPSVQNVMLCDIQVTSFLENVMQEIYYKVQ